eukprot:TRINITY_DN2198_c0_g1_i5.p1 TRINITY_DN2198_c0_g1~~TRINITY_DN2198_c0_g1_i5.p1  ORF type:complete len:120 (-),score=24.25 TRINITY_DN2198_c0_g1_i5:419-778(-)
MYNDLYDFTIGAEPAPEPNPPSAKSSVPGVAASSPRVVGSAVPCPGTQAWSRDPRRTPQEDQVVMAVSPVMVVPNPINLNLIGLKADPDEETVALINQVLDGKLDPVLMPMVGGPTAHN